MYVRPVCFTVCVSPCLGVAGCLCVVCGFLLVCLCAFAATYATANEEHSVLISKKCPVNEATNERGAPTLRVAHDRYLEHVVHLDLRDVSSSTSKLSQGLDELMIQSGRWEERCQKADKATRKKGYGT